MKRYFFASVLWILVSGCGSKPDSPAITQENVRDVLTQYGKENPENEVVIETGFGTIRLKLYEDTPLHRANFVKVIKDGFYDEAEFYRIAVEFMIQGGDLYHKLNYRVPAEIQPNHFHKKGALAMARTSENNPEMQSSASDFYIVHGSRYSDEDLDIDSKNLGLTLSPEQREIYKTIGGYMDLDRQYTVFGEVIEGLDVVEKIAREDVFNTDKPLKKIPFKISLVTR